MQSELQACRKLPLGFIPEKWLSLLSKLCFRVGSGPACCCFLKNNLPDCNGGKKRSLFLRCFVADNQRFFLRKVIRKACRGGLMTSSRSAIDLSRAMLFRRSGPGEGLHLVHLWIAVRMCRASRKDDVHYHDTTDMDHYCTVHTCSCWRK